LPQIMTATLTYTMILAAIFFGRKAILYLEDQEKDEFRKVQ